MVVCFFLFLSAAPFTDLLGFLIRGVLHDCRPLSVESFPTAVKGLLLFMPVGEISSSSTKMERGGNDSIVVPDLSVLILLALGTPWFWLASLSRSWQVMH